jgi:hypothetical protein
MKGSIRNPDMLLIASYMPIAIFWAMSLFIGHCLHKSNVRRDAVNPLQLNADWPNLIMGLMFGVVYIFCLSIFTSASEQRLGELNQSASVIFWVGFFELLLGCFAISGWEALYAYGKKFWYQNRVTHCSGSIYHHAHCCEQHYAYYEQTWQYYNLMEGTNYPPRINERIAEALGFGKIPPSEEEEFKELEASAGGFMI